jgi:hypothetical protein
MLKTLSNIIDSAPSTQLAEYLNSVYFSRKFTAEDIWNNADHGCPDLLKLTAGLLYAGETAWGVPEFEQCVYDVMLTWVVEGQLIKVKLMGQWLMESAEGSSKAWLADFARGDFWLYMDRYQFSRDILGTPEQYLYPLRLNHLIAAQHRRDLRHASRAKA